MQMSLSLCVHTVQELDPKHRDPAFKFYMPLVSVRNKIPKSSNFNRDTRPCKSSVIHQDRAWYKVELNTHLGKHLMDRITVGEGGLPVRKILYATYPPPNTDRTLRQSNTESQSPREDTCCNAEGD